MTDDDAPPRDAAPETQDAGAEPDGIESEPEKERAEDEPADSARAEDKPAAEPAAIPPAAPLRHPGYAFLAIVSAITLAADLGSKWWATDRLEQAKFAARRIEVLKDHVYLIYARNPGGAWGILQGESEALRRPFFLLISVAAVAFILSLYRKLEPRQVALKWGLPFVLGGAVGNLVDRLRYGEVVDFIQVRLTSTFTWPTFNIADVAIVTGVLLMAVDMFTPRRPDVGDTGGGGGGAKVPEKAPAGEG